MTSDNERQKSLNKMIDRLGVIIGLLLDLANKDGSKSDGGQIYRLKQLGLDIEDIAKIMGKSKDKISKQIYRVKSKK